MKKAVIWESEKSLFLFNTKGIAVLPRAVSKATKAQKC